MRKLITAATLSLALSIELWGAVPAAAGDDERGGYVAIGDSIPFGFNPLIPPAQRGNPGLFSGYPEAFAADQRLTLANFSCPGETSGSMISTPTPATPDNGCQRFRARNRHLHIDYTGPQLSAAVAYLRNHPDVRLLTITIGHNDLAMLESACQNEPSCELAGLPGVQARLADNLTTIYRAIRESGYDGTIAAVTYYALNYEDANEATLVRGIDRTLAAVTRRFGGVVASGFRAFQRMARRNDGSSCDAGLVIVLTTAPMTCDFHPSFWGRDLLADTLGRAI